MPLSLPRGKTTGEPYGEGLATANLLRGLLFFGLVFLTAFRTAAQAESFELVCQYTQNNSVNRATVDCPWTLEVDQDRIVTALNTFYMNGQGGTYAEVGPVYIKYGYSWAGSSEDDTIDRETGDIVTKLDDGSTVMTGSCQKSKTHQEF